MSTGFQGARRLARSSAARGLQRDASVAAATCTAGSAEWRFYHGVQAAALDVIHPERTAVRESTSWLDAENPSYRTGFLEASALLATTSVAGDLRVSVPLPRPAG